MDDFRNFCSCSLPSADGQPPIPRLLRPKNNKKRRHSIMLGGPLPQQQRPTVGHSVDYRRHSPQRFRENPLREKNLIRIMSPVITQQNVNLKSFGVVAANKSNTPPIKNPDLLTDSSDIRVSLDRNLHQIYAELRDRKSNNQTRHKNHLSQQLVASYVKQIYKDYNLRDPLEDVSNKYSPFSNVQCHNQQRTRYSAGISSIRNQPQSGIRQSFIIGSFSPGDNRYISSANKQSSKKEFIGSNEAFSQIKWQSKEIRQLFRYCFICEEPILEANIEIHEKEKCPGFAKLYQMPIDKLRNQLKMKIKRLRQETEQCLQGEMSHSEHIQILRSKVLKYLELVQDPNVGKRARMEESFKSVMDSYHTKYLTMHDKLHKLQWFSLMLNSLQEQYTEEVTLKQQSLKSSTKR